MKHTKQDLKEMQAWPLERKIQVTQTRIIEWYQYFNGQIYVSFSGGKDSTVLLDLARRIYPDISAVFADTGLEYPEIRTFVMTKENVKWVRPTMNFTEVIKKHGYPVVSKHIARRISDYRINPNSDWIKRCFANEYTYNAHNIGKWGYLVDAPFLISHKCCDEIKKKPLKQYEKETKRKPIIATMASESAQRESGWLHTGCNSFENGKSLPMSFWNEQDVLQYLKITGIPYCSVYGDIEDDLCGQMELIETEHKLHTTGADRTGCMFCMFGVHLEKEPNRFQRMKITHPKLYDYCIYKLGCGEVMDFINVRY